MYRYLVDNAITYTSEDLVLYRESPFACWMERLTLENPEHGIPPDVGSQAPASSAERQDDIAETLFEEGRDVVLVAWEMEESARRHATLDAMRRGVDFVVNGQLALGPLSGEVNLLMRTSGYSDLGDYLYVPCDTQGKATPHSAFRLCFLADLLHMLQGQLPPQMLIIRGGSDVVPLETDDHIYHYRAVKQRFMTAMREFRKHRMPDPSESSHFGRWSDCAHEVMKQRALHDDSNEDDGELAELDVPMLAVAQGGDAGLRSQTVNGGEGRADVAPGAGVAADQRRAGELQVYAAAAGTLAEQASQLGSVTPLPSAGRAPGHTPNLAPVMASRAQASGRRRVDDEVANGPDAAGDRNLVDVALDNLEFIGSNLRPATPRAEYTFPAQGASLDSRPAAYPDAEQAVLPESELAITEDAPFELPATRLEKQHPLDSVPAAAQALPSTVIDRDDTSAQVAEPEPRPAGPAPRFSWERLEEDLGERDFLGESGPRNDRTAARHFSDSLITNEEYGERE
jgi:hypothetical protein